MNRLVRRQWRSLRRNRRLLGFIRREAPKEERLMLTSDPPPTTSKESAEEQHEQPRDLRDQLREGQALLKSVKEVQFRYQQIPIQMAIEIPLADLTARIEDWSAEVGGRAFPQLGNGGAVADLARLKLHVERQLATLRTRQEQ
jgi:hypothetical protein